MAVRNDIAIAWAGGLGLLLLYAGLWSVHGEGDVPAAKLAVVVAGFAIFIACEIVLIVRTWKRKRIARELGASVIEASKRQARENFTGVLIVAAGIFIQFAHTVFGAAFDRDWAISFALIVVGMGVQMFAQARYVQALG